MTGVDLVMNKQITTEYLPDGEREGAVQCVLRLSSGCCYSSSEVQSIWVEKENDPIPHSTLSFRACASSASLEMHPASSPRGSTSLEVPQSVTRDLRSRDGSKA